MASSCWRGDSKPFSPDSPEDEVDNNPPPSGPIVVPGKLDNSGTTFKPVVVPGKLDKDTSMKTVFKKKIIEVAGPEKKVFAPVEIEPQKKDGTTFKPVEYGSAQTFVPIDLGTIVAGPVVDAVVDKAVDVFKGFRIHKLPRPDQDFAVKWHYTTEADKDEDIIISEFNAYLQVIDELEKEKLILPEGFHGSTIAEDLKTYILRDFRNHNLKLDKENNLAHRAFYAHCAKRAIDGLRDGQFIDNETGYVRKYPEIADILERRINEILYEDLIQPDEVQN